MQKKTSIIAEASEDGRGGLDRHSGYSIGFATKRAGDQLPTRSILVLGESSTRSTKLMLFSSNVKKPQHFC